MLQLLFAHCKSRRLTITAHSDSPLSLRAERRRSLCVLPVFYLGNARDDIGVFAGVVFLVTAEYSNLAALQNVNLWGEEPESTKRIIE